MKDNIVFLYRWDNIKGKFIVESGNLISRFPESLSRYGTVYIEKESDKEKPSVIHYEVCMREGIIYNNGLWLKIRDDRKAKDLFIEEFSFKIKKYQKEINKLNKRIEALK